MIAGQNTKPADKNRKTFGHAKFERKIRHEKVAVRGVLRAVPSALRSQISVQAL
jgi:hypothetical protein